MKIILFISLFQCLTINCQNDYPFRWVVQSKLSLQIGMPINALSFKTEVHFVHPYFELGSGVQSKIFFSGLGPKGLFFENRLQLDAKLVWGKNQYRNPQFFHLLFNNSHKNNSLSYAHYWYWDNRNTSQRSGAWAAEFGKVFVYFENDLFAGQGRDRFRTGVLQIMYRDSTRIWSLNTRIWTGETRGAKVVQDDQYPSFKGYKDLSESLYGKYSHGIVSLSYHQALIFQPVGGELGMDHERIRHFFQNNLIHDFPYFLKKNPMRNRHLPMLDKHGLPFVDPKIQQIKKGKVVFQTNWGYVEN